MILIVLLPELERLGNQQIAKLVDLATMDHEIGKMRFKWHIRRDRLRVSNALSTASISAIQSNPKVSVL